jgi:hypothetical protein
MLNYFDLDAGDHKNVSYGQQFYATVQENAHIFTYRIDKLSKTSSAEWENERSQWFAEADQICTAVRDVKSNISDFTPQFIYGIKLIDHALVMFTDKHNDHATFYTISRHGAPSGQHIVVKSNLFDTYYKTLRYWSQQNVIGKQQPDQAGHVLSILDYFYRKSDGEFYYGDWYTYDTLGYHYDFDTVNVPSTRELVQKLGKGVSLATHQELDKKELTPTRPLYDKSNPTTLIENYKERQRYFEMVKDLQLCHDDEDMEEFDFNASDLFDDDSF